MIRIISPIILFIISSVTYSINSNPDSLSLENKIETDAELQQEISSSRFLDNLDSLIYLWQVQKANSLRFSDTLTSIDTSYIPEFSDSVFLSRISGFNSAVPLSYNKKVKAYIDVYTKKKREKARIMLGLSDYYFPIFEEILEEYNLPQELKYLPIIESALNPRARSRVGASGLWQFMYATGKMYKLEVNSFVDERLDPIKASHAAAKFLSDLYETFGDWILVIAAYNCGPGNVNKAIRRCGGKLNYWDIYYRLPRETRGYVPAFIAAYYTFHYYQEHNLLPVPIDFNIATDTIHVNEKLHLKQVAEYLDYPIEDIKNYNPQYRRDVIPASTKKSYSLVLPQELISRFIAYEDSILNYKKDDYLSDEILKKSPSRVASYGAPPKNSTKLIYKVQPGDNLGYIADWYDVSVSNLRYWNNIYKNLIRVGQNLVVYVPNSKKSQYENISKLSFSEKQSNKGKSISAKTESKIDFASGNFKTYKVRRGDNFWSIARKFPGISNYDIMRANNITNEKSLKPGQILKIPEKG